MTRRTFSLNFEGAMRNDIFNSFVMTSTEKLEKTEWRMSQKTMQSFYLYHGDIFHRGLQKYDVKHRRICPGVYALYLEKAK